MSEIITEDRRTCKQNLSRSSVVSKHPANSYSVDRVKRPYLPPKQFQDANLQKRMWIAAAVQECSLRGNEVIVLEALAFLTDPSYGQGIPSIGSIQEKCLESVSSIHYETVRQCLKRLAQKGAIISEQRGKKQTNFYTLIGFEYKLESCSRDTLNSTNSPHNPKGLMGRRESKKIKIASAFAVASGAIEGKEEKAPPEIANNAMDKINRMLKPWLYR